MINKATSKDDPLTLRSLQKHIILIIIGSLTVACITAFTTVYSTKSDVQELKKVTSETSVSVKDLTINVNDLSKKVEQCATPTAVNQAEVNNLKQDVRDLKNDVGKILNVVLELKTRK